MNTLIAEQDWKQETTMPDTTEGEQQWDLEIKPQDKLFNLHLKDVWH